MFFPDGYTSFFFRRCCHDGWSNGKTCQSGCPDCKCASGMRVCCEGVLELPAKNKEAITNKTKIWDSYKFKVIAGKDKGYFGTPSPTSPDPCQIHA